jgi:ribonuclease HII
MSLNSRFKEDNIIEIGVDEAGRGSFWGPIMAGAVILPNESNWTDLQQSLLVQLRDSKKISPKKREILADKIKELLPFYGVGIVYPNEINKQGIQWANKEVFRRAVQNCYKEDLTQCRLLIDGMLSIDDWKGEQELIIEGDNKYIAIAAASILAKVEHDRWIQEYCKTNPECDERYHLVSSKGYGTAKHRDAIKIYGGHELHRELYIQNWLPDSIQKPKMKTKTKKALSVNADQCLIKF